METSRENIANQASELIQSHDCIVCMSLKKSQTLNAFLAVARKKKHRVCFLSALIIFRCLLFLTMTILMEFPRTYLLLGLSMLQPKLWKQQRCFSSPLKVMVKVVIPAVAVFPDGSCFVPAGGLQVALAAHRHAIPLYVLTAFYKVAFVHGYDYQLYQITPMFVPDPHVLNPNLPPRLPFFESRGIAGFVIC